jgi:hypothetical protein
MPDDCTEQRFLADVASHEMIVLRDDGVSRHIRFKKPQTRCYSFDLITWPGHLCYTGDMGTFVFQRLEDMFMFFRADSSYRQRDGQTLYTNPGYWGEKLESVDRGDGFKEFSIEAFRAAVKDCFESYTDDDEDWTKESRAELWDEINDFALYVEDEFAAVEAIRGFHNPKHSDLFSDFEYTTDEYSFRFIWCCYALAWGIKKYDEARALSEVTA